MRQFLVFALLILSTAVHADEGAVRPKVGLVLGGGGARGAAHIGVLEVLEKMRIPVDCVAGTSMGALVAGAWAAGVRPSEMRETLARADWNDLFQDNPDYAEMSYRNKLMLRRFLPGTESGLSSNGVTYQTGVVAGQKIKLFFNQLVRAGQGEPDIGQLALPLSIIATDIGNGERVVFRDGALTQAMRASMSVPGLLAPVDYQGRKLVDGGLVDNVPIREVQERCAPDVVIAVNVGSPLLRAEEVGSLLTVSAQMVNILTEQNVTRSLALLKSGDIHIKPDLTGITAGDFARSSETADRGRLAAEALAAHLAPLAVTPQAYAHWRQQMEPPQGAGQEIHEIEFAGLKQVSAATLNRHLHVQLGETMKPGQLDSDLMRMYGDGYFERVDYTVLSQRERNLLRIMPVEKSWGPDYLRFGINLQADNSQGSAFGIRAGYHRTWLNSLGAEMLVTAEVGSANRLGVNFYQPLDPAQRLFFEATAGVEQTRLNIYQNDQRIAQYKSIERGISLSLGANIGLLGPVRLSRVERSRTFELDIGMPSLPDLQHNLDGWRTSVDFDQMDRMYFPTRGWSAQASWFVPDHQHYSRLNADLKAAFSFGGAVFNARFRYVGSPHGSLPAHDAGSLGGFQNLTAFAPGQILGDDIRYLGLQTERILGRAPLGLRGDLRLGLILEGAKAGSRYTESARKGLLDSTAVYLGGETPLGQAYLGFGYSTSGVSNLFLFIGTP